MGADDGLGPNSLEFDNKGNLYGTTEYGGGAGDCSNGGCGTIFELVLVDGAWTKNVLYRFAGGTDGSVPQAGVIVGPNGNLYGTTWKGGDLAGDGTVFELQHSESGWTEILLQAFSGNDGSAPISGLIRDHSGNLYGTTSGGGAANAGTVFRLSHEKEGWVEKVLHSFTGSDGDGAAPYAGSLTFDTAGNLYGTTSAGGSVNSGTIFELTNPTSHVTESILYSFPGRSSGSAPYTGVIFDSEGNLYGTASFGGSGGDGTIFSLKNVNGQWTESVLNTFNGSNGSEPIGNIVFGAAGELYGTASSGGAHGIGEIFEIAVVP